LSLEFVISIALGALNFAGLVIIGLIAYIARGLVAQNCKDIFVVTKRIDDEKAERERQVERLATDFRHSEDTSEQWKLKQTADYTRMEVTVSRLEGALSTAISEMRADLRSLLLEFPVFRTDMTALKQQVNKFERKVSDMVQLLGSLKAEDSDQGDD
jgi:chromosome segregation ATPase